MRKAWLLTIALTLVFCAPGAGQAANQLQQLMGLANRAMRAGNTLMAIKNYMQVVTQTPNNHQAWYKLGVAYYKAKQYDNAVRAATRAIALAPDNPKIKAKYYAGRAWACSKAGLNAQAVTDMESAVELAPEKPVYAKWLNLAKKQLDKKGEGRSLSAVTGQAGGQSGGREERAEEEQEAEQEQEAEAEQEQEQEAEQEEQEQGADGQSASAGPAKCRKAYFICMAECAGISSEGPRAICERACKKASQACK